MEESIKQYKIDYFIKEWNSDHPSHFERVLYLIGFLLSKGINVNALFNTYENLGKSLDVKEIYSSFWQNILQQTPKYVVNERLKFAKERFNNKDSF